MQTLIGLLPSGYDRNGKFVMNKKTLFTDFMPLQDNSKNHIVTVQNNAYFVYGYPVLLSDYVADHEAFLGDFKKVCANLAENIGVNKITDEQTAKQLEMLSDRTAQLSAKFDTAQANRVSGESVLRTELVNLVTNLGNTLTDTQKQNSDGTARLLSQFEQRLQSIEQRNAADMQNMRNEMAVQLGNINANTKNQLEEMRGMVGEKLQTTLDDKISRSFATVSEQLNKVYSGLGLSLIHI